MPEVTRDHPLPLIVIVGPTASGKTSRAVHLAHAIGGEIISGDSRQIYRGMDLGTGKDLDEYGDIPYHLIDICPAGYKYNLYEYLRDCNTAVKDIRHRGNYPILCGGTGMYIEAVLNGLALPQVPRDEALRQVLKNKTLAELSDILASYRNLRNVNDTDTVARALRAIEIQQYYRLHPEEARYTVPSPRRDAVIVGVDIDRDTRRRRIAERLDARLRQGMVEEVKKLLDSGVAADDLIYYGLEYKYITRYVIGELTYAEMHEGLLTAIRQFAKRQMTWLRGMERRAHHIHWLPGDLPDEDFTSRVISLI